MLRRGQAGPAALIALISFFALAFSLAPVNALPTRAQAAAPVIDNMRLQLWPEYDDPGLLVIQAGQFVTTTFPLQVAFPAPAGLRNVQATYQDASSSLINQPFEIKDGRLTYELPVAGFQLEYYLDRAPGNDQRNITYSFVAPYAINTLRVEVQQPARSSSFTLTPASESSQQANGLTYYVFNRRNLAAGEKLDITISYAKTDTGLSSPQLAVAPTTVAGQSAAPAAAAPQASSALGLLPWILFGLAALIVVAVLIYWLLTQRRPAPAPTTPVSGKRNVEARTASPARSARPTVPARPAGDAVAFCTNCGHALKPEDRFCSQCGAPRRS